MAINGEDQLTHTPAPSHVLNGEIDLTNLPSTDRHDPDAEVDVGACGQRDGAQAVRAAARPARCDPAHRRPQHACLREYLIGQDVVCADPRPQVSVNRPVGRPGQPPVTADLFYDPDKPSDTCIPTMSAPGTTEFDNLQLSSVSPARDDTTNAVIPGKQNAIVHRSAGATGAAPDGRFDQGHP